MDLERISKGKHKRTITGLLEAVGFKSTDKLEIGFSRWENLAELDGLKDCVYILVKDHWSVAKVFKYRELSSAMTFIVAVAGNKVLYFMRGKTLETAFLKLLKEEFSTEGILKQQYETIEFYGNHYLGYDRIPEDSEGLDKIPAEAWRKDCPFALSPYWNYVVVCSVPKGNRNNFSTHPVKLSVPLRILSIRKARYGERIMKRRTYSDFGVQVSKIRYSK